MHVRPMESADLDAASAASAAAFGLELSERAARELWRDRVAHGLRTDPGGAFVAERDDEIIGVAQVLCRERLWCLSLLTVQPGVQSGGAGRALLERSLEYDGDTDCGLIVSSNDPRALRLYARYGFTLLPTFQTEGEVDPRTLPAPDPEVQTAGVDDLEELESISREVRGAPHTTELQFALSRGAEMLRHGDRGFVVAHEDLGVWLLVALDEAVATALLWRALAIPRGVERPCARWITGDQPWAIDVFVRAGLRLTANGALCVRGRPGPLAPFLPSGPFA